MVPSLQIFLLTICTYLSHAFRMPRPTFILPLPIQSVRNKLTVFLNDERTQHLSWTPCYELSSPWAPILPFHYTGYYPSLLGPDMLCAYKADRCEIWSQETETTAWYMAGNGLFIPCFLYRELPTQPLQWDYWEVRSFCCKIITEINPYVYLWYKVFTEWAKWEIDKTMLEGRF
jgi:hypothetical protein